MFISRVNSFCACCSKSSLSCSILSYDSKLRLDQSLLFLSLNLEFEFESEIELDCIEWSTIPDNISLLSGSMVLIILFYSSFAHSIPGLYYKPFSTGLCETISSVNSFSLNLFKFESLSMMLSYVCKISDSFSFEFVLTSSVVSLLFW